jgi:outer membrane receptor protein involved in Fe transport
VGGDLSYVGDRLSFFPAASDIPRSEIPSYATLDLRAGITMSGWRIGAYAKNVTDELGILNAEPEAADGSTGIYLLNVVNPRTFGISVSHDF